MNKDFAKFVADNSLDSVVSINAASYALGEKTYDLPTEEMKKRLEQVLGDDGFKQGLDLLLHRSEYMDQIGLTYLLQLWTEPTDRATVTGAVDGAKSKLMAVEVGTAIICMYILYLLATGGKKRHHTAVKRNPDGSVEMVEDVEYYSFSEPVLALYKSLAQGENPEALPPGEGDGQ